jgi:hypothetical protein
LSTLPMVAFLVRNLIRMDVLAVPCDGSISDSI